MKSIKRIVAVTFLLLALVTTIFAVSGCSSSKPGDVDPATIRYDGDTITWDEVRNAAKYSVKINGTEYTAITPAIAHRSEASSVTIEITAMNKKDDAGDTATRTFTKLDTIENLYFDSDGTLTWDPVSGATAYVVEVNGKKSEKLSACTYSSFETGKLNRIRVKASSTDDSTFAYWSDMAQKTYLAPPSNVKFDGSKVTWEGYADAKGYDVYINGSKVNGDAVTSSYYMYEPNGDSFNLTVKALGDGVDVFSSTESASKRYVYLAQASNFLVSEGSISWDPVDGASSYSVLINGVEKTVTSPVFTNIPAGRDNLIKVKPIGKSTDADVVYFSEWSSEQKVHILATPVTSWNSALNLDGEAMNAFQWEFSEGKIAGYEILITLPDGTTESHSASKHSDNFGYAFIESGTYKIQVKAVAESNTEIYESAYSDPITVIRLAPPTPNSQNFIESKSEDLASGFTVNFVKDPKAMGYAIYKEGALIINSNKGDKAPNSINVTDVVNGNVTTRQELTYSAQAIGDGKATISGGDRIVTLSSLSSKNYSFSITVLAAPEITSLEGTVLTWSNVQGANGYKVSGIGDGAQKSTETFDFKEISISAGDYEVKVCARGNGSNVLASPLSAPTRVRKLAAPTNIHVITSGESEGSLDFDEVIGATGYSVFFNANEEPINSNNINSIYDHVTTTGIRIRVVAIADSYDDANQIYCLTSEPSQPVSMTKLATPYFPETPHNNKSILWVGPNNITAATPGYHVYTGSGLAYSGIYTSTEFDLSGFDAGTYTFYVQAVGDGRTTINSDRSDPLTVVKLEQPTVQIDTNQGTYFWRHISDAQRYVVRVNGEIKATIHAEASNTYYSWAPVDVFDKIATYAVSVTAVSDSAIDSKPTLINQEVKQLAQPEFTTCYSEPAFVAGGKIIVNATAKDPNANGFVFTVGGSTSERQDSGKYEFTAMATGTYAITVTSYGAKFDANEVYYINSLPATMKTVTLLGSVGMSTISLSIGGKLSWAAVDGAILGYEIVVDYGDGTTETFTTSGNQPYYQFDLYDAQYNPTAKFNMANAGNYTFKIRALGNTSGTLVTSDWVVWDMSKKS